MSDSDRKVLYFAHLSDPHLSSLDSVRWRQLLNKRALGYLSWRRGRRHEHRAEVLEALSSDLEHTGPEHILITGDLTHIGLPDEFRQARQWLEQLGHQDRVTVVPGNHDAYARARWSETFSQWEPYMRSDPGFGERHGSGNNGIFPSLRIRNGVAFIGLSSARATAPFLATGTLGVEQISRLAAILKKTAQQGLFRVVMLHHPPRPQDEKWRKRLTDGDALCRVLEDSGAEMVLHGHSHRSLKTELGFRQHRIPVFGIPSASAIGRKAGRRAQYYLYTVRREGDYWSIHVRVKGYEPETDSFVLVHEHHVSVPVMSVTSF